MGEMQHLVNAETLASFLGVRVEHVYALTRRGAIPHYRVGKYLRYPLEEALKALARNGKGGSNEGGNS